MIEKVNPGHPDKVADRIAGAIVDEAYRIGGPYTTIAVEVLIGHANCHIIIECGTPVPDRTIREIVYRISETNCTTMFVTISQNTQDAQLNANQQRGIRCGDNGIFKGIPLTDEQKEIGIIAREIYEWTPCDGKYILDGKKLIICQSNAISALLHVYYEPDYPGVIVNPLGDWVGGLDVDTGATNRKLGSDMGDAVTGGGLHGKDLSKADVSVNIYAHLKAQETGEVVQLCCAIGDDTVDGKPYAEIVEIARTYIAGKGGFEKFAEWGLF